MTAHPVFFRKMNLQGGTGNLQIDGVHREEKSETGGAKSPIKVTVFSVEK
jgi:hypothetical protein